jgi:predicted TIM-barrel fold metal-dependent hydrolase
VALASAVNDWLIAEWLEREPRLRTSIVVPSKQPERAAREIDRLGDHPGVVQVFLPARSALPYGQRHFWPIYEAAVRHDLVIGLLAARGQPPTPAGRVLHEEYVGMAGLQSQLMSLIVEASTASAPRVAVIEGGFAWLPPFLWRFDKEFKGLRREIPWTTRLPSEYVQEHIRFTLQPIDGPPDAARLLRLIDELGSDELLMFSTDYPHWHFDTADEAVPTGLPPDLERKLMAENARVFYRLPTLS